MSNAVTGNDAPNAASRAAVAAALKCLSRAALCVVYILVGFVVVEAFFYAVTWAFAADYGLAYRLLGAAVGAPLAAAFENAPSLILFGFVWAFARYFAATLAATSPPPAKR